MRTGFFRRREQHSPREIQITLEEEDGDRELGDTRYNIINLIVTDTPGSGAFGVGSNIAHPCDRGNYIRHG